MGKVLSTLSSLSFSNFDIFLICFSDSNESQTSSSTDTDSFMSLSIDRRVYYRLIQFIYQNRLLYQIEKTKIWRHFKQLNPDIELSAMELKLCFCFEIMPNLENFDWIDQNRMIYLAGRKIPKNIDELFLMNEFKYESDWVLVEDYQTPLSVNQIWSDRFMSVGVIPVKSAVNPTPKNECKVLTDEPIVRPISELMKIVMGNGIEEEGSGEPRKEEVDGRIAQRVRENLDFKEFWKTRGKKLEFEEPPEELSSDSDSQTSEPFASDSGLTDFSYNASQMTVNEPSGISGISGIDSRQYSSDHDSTVSGTRRGHGTLRSTRSKEPFPKFANRMQTRYHLRKK